MERKSKKGQTKHNGNVDAFLFELTEWGNSKRFEQVLNGDFRWVDELGKWVYWDGSLWREDNDGRITRQIDNLLEHILLEISDYEKQREENKQRQDTICKENNINLDAVRDISILSKNIQDELEETIVVEEALSLRIAKLLDWRTRCQSAANIKNTTDLTKSSKRMTVSVTDFDSDELLIGCKNGLVDLVSGCFVRGQKDFLMMKSVAVGYDKNAKCPKWDEFVRWAMCDDDEMVGFIKRFIGSGLIGRKGKDKLAIFHGASGRNGKSTLVDTINAIYGDFSTVSSPSLLCEGKSNTEYYLAPLVGQRMLIMNEMKNGSSIATEVVKSMIDSGQIVARHPYGRTFRFQPVFTAILCTNPKPRIGTDVALWRRIWLVPFDNQVSEEEADRDLRNKLLEEGSGILNWCIEGAKAFLAKGYMPPKKVLAATEEYRDEEDMVKRFLEECCERRQGERLRTSRMREAYAEWCKKQGYIGLAERRFTQELKRLGLQVQSYGKSRQSTVFDYGLRDIVRFNQALNGNHNDEDELDDDKTHEMDI